MKWRTIGANHFGQFNTKLDMILLKNNGGNIIKKWHNHLGVPSSFDKINRHLTSSFFQFGFHPKWRWQKAFQIILEEKARLQFGNGPNGSTDWLND
jgi:hypothetical protein